MLNACPLLCANSTLLPVVSCSEAKGNKRWLRYYFPIALVNLAGGRMMLVLLVGVMVLDS